MNEQKNDSVSQEALVPPGEASQSPALATKTHKGILDSIVGLWHKKNPESILQETALAPEIPLPIIVTDSVPATEVSVTPPISTPTPEKSHFHISEKIAHIFHKKPQIENIETPITSETAESVDISHQTTTQTPETPVILDERFARLLKHDTTYHSMIRSEDIKNIQLQLSMRYMLLMLAIFVVIAWVVNNRVIMFGFSDFPFLARTRDALFTILTGLFSLTVWFGAAVWFRHRIGTLILQILAGVLFVTVLVSIYLPFWR